MTNTQTTKNVWTDGESRIVSETRPAGYWYPVVNFRRVRGSSYTPYMVGSPEWVKAANLALAEEAQANFERR